MQVYLTVTPGAFQKAAGLFRSFAHMAYKIGPDSTLLRQNLLLQTKGGLLAVGDRDAPEIEQPEKLCAAVLRECNRRNYAGVFLAFEQPPTKDRQTFSEQLGRMLSSARRTLYITEQYAHSVPSGIPLICTSLSGGNFTERLKEAAMLRGGAERLALDVQRLRMDFRLPAKTGTGVPLSEEELQSLIERETPSVFFSKDLCARYFTYIRNDEAHFVLFDDADTLNQKLRLGASLGFSAAFMVWPEVQDIAGRLQGVK